MSLRKFVSHVTKEGHRKKKSMSLDNNCLQMAHEWETPATNMTKYHIYSITNFMANSLAEKTFYSDFSF